MLVLIVLGFGIAGALLADSLLLYEYKYCRDQWEEDGSPSGVFWTVADASDGWEGDASKERVAWRWLFRTPNWISAIPPLKVKLRVWRLLWFIGFSATLALLIHLTV